MSSRTAADRAVLGARIRTLDPERPWAQAVAMRDGAIVAVGSDAEVREACDARTELVDGTGLVIVPGLTDSHLHPVWATDFAVGVSAEGLLDRDAFAAALRGERERVGPEAIVRAWSVDYALLGGAMDGALLAELAGGPALAVFHDLHTYLATPDLLERAGVTGEEQFPDASEVVVRDGRPTGELREFSAYFRLADRLPGASPEARRARVVEVLAELNALGLTGAHVMDGSPGTYDLLREIEARGELTMRLIVPLWVKPEHGDEHHAEWAGHVGAHGELWRGGTAKFFVDGVVETGTAWLEEPDADGDGLHAYWPDPQRYASAVATFADAGFACTTHAIGDRAVRAALDAYAAAGPPARGLHRIEHLETLGDATLERLAAESVAASMQPLHMRWRRADGADEWARRLGRERVARGFRTGDLLRSGAIVALGSDWPVAPADPRYGLAWARLRRPPRARDAPVFEPAQRMDAEQALAGYTTAPARIAGETDRSGRIAPGFRADLTGLASDPVATPADDLVDVPVRLTVVAGRVVHRA
ncbi:MAG TPA: amidohydrolase family protein [Solirubrobacteraceae bacterium]|nr:amidohydrolase family protein [Solirubrobacteraceae bacterium]